MLIYLFQGIGYGFAAASQPGPFQAFLVSQSLTRGWKRALPGALAPLVSDGPIILLCVLVLSQLPDWLQQVMYILGGLFVLYLAYGAFKSWRDYDETISHPELSNQQTILKAALTNALSPGAYLFWMFITGPLLVQGWRETPIHGVALLVGFYATLISGLAVIIVIFGSAARLGPKLNRALLGISSIVLFGFGLYQLWKGIF
ncbi:MAG: LysE family transporter [Anaerolineales bacterium]|nr:LysE family transporter [Anaerolineales bacterium]MCB9111826.1 LysE family transporter [Anaerolineales bacterium]